MGSVRRHFQKLRQLLHSKQWKQLSEVSWNTLLWLIFWMYQFVEYDYYYSVWVDGVLAQKLQFHVSRGIRPIQVLKVNKLDKLCLTIVSIFLSLRTCFLLRRFDQPSAQELHLPVQQGIRCTNVSSQLQVETSNTKETHALKKASRNCLHDVLSVISFINLMMSKFCIFVWSIFGDREGAQLLHWTISRSCVSQMEYLHALNGVICLLLCSSRKTTHLGKRKLSCPNYWNKLLPVPEQLFAGTQGMIPHIGVNIVSWTTRS